MNDRAGRALLVRDSRLLKAARWASFLALVGIFLGSTLARGAEPASAHEAAFQARMRPLLVKYCEECHSADLAEAELNLQEFATVEALRQHPRPWQRVAEMLSSGQMPPKDAPQPTQQERSELQAWVHQFLKQEAQAHAGDPGQVVLRRLSNAEYTYTLRDLTGMQELRPAEEFPVDGAAGEGFTNTGNALVMSPALLTKYLDAAKEVSEHIVLLPDGFRFSPTPSRRDQTDLLLAKLRSFYGSFADQRPGEKMNLQGIIFTTNGDGALPLGKYLFATVVEREALTTGTKTIAQVADEHQLSPKYLQILWQNLNDSTSSPVLDGIRRNWKSAKPDQVPALVAEIAAWQSGLWKFSSVGHIGKVNGPKHWQEPVNPLVSRQELKFKIPASSGSPFVTIALLASDAGDGGAQDVVIWERPRLVASGRSELPLRNVRQLMRNFEARREQVFASTARCLAAADFASQQPVNVAELAKERGLDEDILRSWMNFLGIGEAPTSIQGHFTTSIASSGDKTFIQGWGSDATPLILANSSDQEAHIPGRADPHGVVVHPSPDLNTCVGWQSPVEGIFQIQARVQPAHAACGNGITWSLELRRGGTRQRLAGGAASGSNAVPVGPLTNISIHSGDVVVLSIGARDRNHACDLTAVDLTLTPNAPGQPGWNLAQDVSSDILAGNPHADRQGHANVWHFFTEPENGSSSAVTLPAGSLLANWQTTTEPLQKEQLAEALQTLLLFPPPQPVDSPDALLYRQLMSFDGPHFSKQLAESLAADPVPTLPEEGMQWGLDPRLFGTSPTGESIDPDSLAVKAPAIIQFQLPAELAAGYELVVTGRLAPSSGPDASVRLAIASGQLELPLGISPATDEQLGSLNSAPALVAGTSPQRVWTDTEGSAIAATPFLAAEGSPAEQRLLRAFDDFRSVFPIALCYTKIVPVDEVVTLTLFYREDDQLVRLMLDDSQKAELDRMWDELHYISQDALTQLDSFAQLLEYASQDADPKVFEPMRDSLNAKAEAFRLLLASSESEHLAQLMKFAAQAFRHPLNAAEQAELMQLYSVLRQEELSHIEAFRLTLAKVLMSPDFLYHIEIPGAGDKAVPVSDWELASRLSYFLWSSEPDEELRQLAAAGQLHQPEVLTQQTRRMLQDARTRRLATEFACQWLHIYDFDQLDEKSERHFPDFVALRGDMYEESIRFFQDLFQNNGKVVDILDADYTFLNESLARHYEIPGVTGPEWRRVDGLKSRQRGGILAQASTLSKQSGASRTSPTLRGNWISEVLLGERLPRPPKDVPQLPDDPSAFEGLTVRQIVEKHAADPKCAVCHIRVDPMGFSLEAFDAIGRFRQQDAGNLPLETGVVMQDGTSFSGLEGLRKYLITQRRDAFVRQFSKKLLGYALGREVQLSDEPLLEEIQQELATNSGGVQLVIDKIVHSPQFLMIRGSDAADENSL